MINPPYSGESVRECIDQAGMTVKECAVRIGVTPNNMCRLVNGRIGISSKVALGLEEVGWSNAEFWLRLQAQYDLAQIPLENAATSIHTTAVQEETHGVSARKFGTTAATMGSLDH